MRSDDVVFAHVTRDTFTVAGIFNHTVFEPTAPGQPMMAERSRLWKIFDERSARGAPAGSVIAVSPIVLSGHSLYFVNLASTYARVIRRIDP